MAGKVAKIGIFVALAMIFSYIEMLIPFHFGIPGVKLGVANIVVVAGLYLLGAKETFVISLLRILLMGLMFGNGVSLLYSMAGGMLSFLVMCIAKKTRYFSVLGVSVAGGTAHNIGQLAAVAFVLGSSAIAVYLPVLLAAGVVTGALIGLLSRQIINTLGGKPLL